MVWLKQDKDDWFGKETYAEFSFDAWLVFVDMEVGSCFTEFYRETNK